LGTATSVAAVALGASIVEKHFTIARDDGGPDADFSLEPSEFTQLCKDSFYAWQSIGRVNYVRTASETKNLLFRRSLYAVKDIKQGEVITKENVRSIRPGFGLPPSSLPKLLGRRVTCDVERGIAFDWKFVE
jgi:N-acetylneuraminate synthase